MKTFYICDKNDFMGHHHQFNEGHFIDLPNGRILLCTETRNEEFQKRWLAQSHIFELPHPLSGETLTDAHVAEIKHVLPDVSTNDNAWSLSKKVSAIHPLMHLR
jgi:hypothetical protein